MWSSPRVVARLAIGDVIQLGKKTLEITDLSSDYQRNTIAAYKTATVRDISTGETSEVKLYANQRYSRYEETTA